MGRTSEIVIREETCWAKDDIMDWEQVIDLTKSFVLQCTSNSVSDYAPSFYDYRFCIYRAADGRVSMHVLSNANDLLKDVTATIERPPSALPPTSASLQHPNLNKLDRKNLGHAKIVFIFISR